MNSESIRVHASFVSAQIEKRGDLVTLDKGGQAEGCKILEKDDCTCTRCVSLLRVQTTRFIKS